MGWVERHFRVAVPLGFWVSLRRRMSAGRSDQVWRSLDHSAVGVTSSAPMR